MRNFITYICIGAIAFIIGVVVFSEASRVDTIVENELLHLTQTYHDAVKNKNEDTLDIVLSSNLTVIRVDNSVIGKDELKSIIKNNNFIIDSITINNIVLNATGDKASLECESTEVAHLINRKSVVSSGRVKFSYEKFQNKWQILSITVFRK